MQPESPPPCEGQIAVFYQRHRTGLVTLVFTDLVDSTALMRQLGDQAGTTFLQQRRHIVRQTLKEFADGEEIETAGDSFLLIFAKPSDAVRFALLVQARFRAFRHEKQVGLLERIGIHLGEVVIKEHETEAKAKDLYGLQIGACARVMSLAQGGQVLMTRGVFDSARQVLKGEDISGVGRLSWISHGPYLLKGIEEPVEVCEVGEVGQSPLSAPKTTEKAERYVTAENEPVLGWRPAIGLEVPNTKWVLEEKLGEGGFGEVWLGRHQTMKERRVFKFCFRADRVRSLKREMTLFRLIKERIGDHPNIVSLREVYFDQPPFYVEMDYVEGQDLKTWSEERGGVGSVPVEVKLEIIAQVAEALQSAHDAGVIHRDVKPANILVGSQRSEVRGQRTEDSDQTADLRCPTSDLRPLKVKLTDFGIGQVVSEEYLKGVTKAGFTQTMLGSTSSQTGTQLYMAPELLAGKPASTRSDIYSLGVVLFQLLVGDFTRPITTDWQQDVTNPLLRDDLKHCFAGNPQDRFADAGQLAKSLRALAPRQAALAEQQAAAAARQKAANLWRLVRMVGVAALVFGLGLSLVWFLQRRAKVRWAHERALPEISRLANEGSTAAAFAMAVRAETYIPNDPALSNLWQKISVRAVIETTPAGAEIYVKEYRRPDSSWQHLGKSPLQGIRLPSGFFRWQIKKEGYALLDRAAWTRDGTNRFVLDPLGFLPAGMVRVEGGQTWLQLTGLEHLEGVPLEDYFLDTYEVSNRAFKEFIERGGYGATNYWKHPFIKQGKALTWAEALAEFRDATGRPGPATWSNGTYPEGQADHPVTGICWYEAAAYAEFAGKRLPSLHHWSRAANPWEAEFIVPLSNYAAQGPAHVGSYQGMTWCGAYDMAGNVKEWCVNEAGQGKRYILGGAWSEPTYMFSDADAQPPFDRSATYGFRCVKLRSTNALAQGVDGPMVPAYRNYANEQPVSDETFRIFKSLFSYDRTGLNDRIEAVDESSAVWRREKVSFNAAYGSNERVTAYLFLPKKFAPPFQAIVCFPGSDAIYARSSENLWYWKYNSFLVESGRAVMFPIYKGTFERQDGLRNGLPMPTSSYRDHVIQWSKDLGRAIDYLETRKDIQRDKLAYYGISWGAALGAVLPALEDRLKANVLVSGGFCMQPTLPQVDQINFVRRVTMPTLMLNARYDFFFPIESSQNPMFRLLGTPDKKDKSHLIFESGHLLPKPQLEKETLDWLDRYLGPVK